MAIFVRIAALAWADLLVEFVLYLLVNYLTNVWGLSTRHAAAIVNFWNGITLVLAFMFAFIVDAFSGDFYMLVFSSIANSIGLGLLTMSTPTVFGPCKEDKKECVGDTQKVLFYTALVFIAVGMAGHIVSLAPFLDLQRKRQCDRDMERKKERETESGKEYKRRRRTESEEDPKTRLQFSGLVLLLTVVVVGGIGLPYVKPWKLRFGIPAICSVVATMLFFTGWLKYEHKDLEGSPLTTTIKVFLATARNFSKPTPNPNELCNEAYTPSTSSLRCFDKAAIKLPDGQQPNKWNVCSLREVEDTKIYIRMIPMWLSFVGVGMVLSVGNTYYLEQANHLNKKLGIIKVTIPNFLLLYSTTSSIFAYFYSVLTRFTKKYAPPIGITMSMILSVLCCIVSAKVEAHRLHRIREHGLLDKPDEEIPMSIFALLPQFMLLAGVDGIAKASIMGFFRHQTPESMHKYLDYCTKGVLGLGSMMSVVSAYVVGKVSERNGKPSWFRPTLSKSRLDRYYWVLSALSAVNLVIYIIVAYFYRYKEPLDGNEDEAEGGEMTEGLQEMTEGLQEPPDGGEEVDLEG